jgi:glycosyltransferase involved in cell wall biosynthesis
MSLPAVTAVVPSYRHGAFIRRRIESILAQTYRGFELIVIDDCSQDESDAVIRQLQKEHGFAYIRNERNSGTPFAAWERAAGMARGRFLWICESDDVAEPRFLETAVAALDGDEDATLFYCDSNVIDAEGRITGHTDDYFHGIWKETRWDRSFTSEGSDELRNYQVRGQTVPNMSSALIRTSTFRAAYTPFLKRLKLTGDWLFIGLVMKRGRVIYRKETHSNFRSHGDTSRASVASARSQAEFIIAKYLLFAASGMPTGSLARVLSTDAVRFLHEPASWKEVLGAMFRISPLVTMRVAGSLAISLLSNRAYVDRFVSRYRTVKGGS